MNFFSIRILISAFTLFCAISLINPEFYFVSAVHAEEEKKEKKYKDVQTRKRESVGAKCSKALEKIQVTLEEELWAESLKALQDVEASSKTCKSDYEQTQIWQFSAYVYFSLDDFPNANKSALVDS